MGGVIVTHRTTYMDGHAAVGGVIVDSGNLTEARYIARPDGAGPFLSRYSKSFGKGAYITRDRPAHARPEVLFGFFRHFY